MYSETSDRYYVGYTSDYKRRLTEHNASERDTYTGKHRPWRLEAVFECGKEESEAKKLEVFIKKQKSRHFLKRIIDSDELSGELGKLVRVPKFRD